VSKINLLNSLSTQLLQDATTSGLKVDNNHVFSLILHCVITNDNDLTLHLLHRQLDAVLRHGTNRQQGTAAVPSLCHCCVLVANHELEPRTHNRHQLSSQQRRT